MPYSINCAYDYAYARNKVNNFMARHNIDTLIMSICEEWKVKVLVDTTFQKDYGECYPDSNEIMLSSKYSTNQIKLAVFLHELSHIITMRRKGKRYIAASIFQEEFAVWTLAQELHLKYLDKPFCKAQADFMIKCLKTYSQHHYSFKKRYNKTVKEDIKKKLSL